METVDLINVPILKGLIKNEIDRKVANDICTLNDKLKKLNDAELNCSVEIYGLHDARLHDKKTRNYYIRKMCALLKLNYKSVIDSEYKKNHIRIKLTDAATAREWQVRSCQTRLKNYDFNVNFDGPVKIFVAASNEHKQLLKRTRDMLLNYYKYVSLCKNGVMVRENDTSKIYIVKNENDIYDLLIKAKMVETTEDFKNKIVDSVNSLSTSTTTILSTTMEHGGGGGVFI
ncbi:Fp25k [Trabala vishnou gigantina nucleopolyhedrovirus]|uniref:Fp25k n=1 Tax=Trabala vishnou gigantina nucleopolyhedrovirus TaxID=2863583 RepID=UPI002481A5A1|nr:Fp25k [Trabala vishnou gigantina nucleopolyhedrovirus]QYC92731.1 Fp25k [Trabala vishnou gigantina nucleopolyhedrovirus]